MTVIFGYLGFVFKTLYICADLLTYFSSFTCTTKILIKPVVSLINLLLEFYYFGIIVKKGTVCFDFALKYYASQRKGHVQVCITVANSLSYRPRSHDITQL